ncbi:hypothetical protein ACI79D_09380 [Geodermatophilus sp. SYSU D00708]
MTVTDDEIRSPAISRRLLGTREIVLVHHTDCGMLTFTDEDFRVSIEQEVGTRPHWHAEAFAELAEDVRTQRQRILDSPFHPGGGQRPWLRLRRGHRQALGGALTMTTAVRPRHPDQPLRTLPVAVEAGEQVSLERRS